MNRLAVVTCHFNWAGYDRPRQNLLRFLRQMSIASIPVFGIEVYVNGDPQMTRGREGWLQIEADERSMMFIKENLINLAIQIVPTEYNQIAWVDADLMFANPHWHIETAAALQHCCFLQLFNKCHWTAKNGAVELTKSAAAHVGMDHTWKGHPGFAWAAHRSFFDTVGLYQDAILGHGDSVLAMALLEVKMMQSIRDGIGPLNYNKYKEWLSDLKSFISERPKMKRVGCISGEVFHEWHGARPNRKYAERGHILKTFSSDTDITINENGLLEWTPEADGEMVAAVRQYFTDRREDG